MRTEAYSEAYLDDAMSNLGDAFEYAVHEYGMSGEQFADCFVKSQISESFGKGDPKFVTGMSGIELARTVLNRCGVLTRDDRPNNFGYSPEYWVGWVYAYYQWSTGLSFEEIFTAVPYGRLHRMYWPLHEADITKAASIMDDIVREQKTGEEVADN